MRRGSRKTTPRVKDGKVQRKNRTDLSPHYSLVEPGKPIIERHRPGRHYRHLLLQKDVAKFIGLLPDWEELSKGLKAVLLAPGEENLMGWYCPGVVAICAWKRELCGEWTTGFVDEHRSILDRLGVIVEPISGSYSYVNWTHQSAKAFQLMHILLHELGHHHDRMNTRSQRRSSRGEEYAESYANQYADRIWTSYHDAFGWTFA